MPEGSRLIADVRLWGVLVLLTITAACWLFRLSGRAGRWSARVRQILAMLGGALMGCGIWSLHHLARMTGSGGFLTVRHPSLTLLLSLVAAMVGSGLALGNVFTSLDRQGRSRTAIGIDSLTGLQTRSQLERVIRNSMMESQQDGAKFALAMVDMDRFKGVNDTLGHDVGDMVLQQIADRLISCVPSKDVIARIGSDEFMVLLKNVDHPRGSQAICRKILNTVGQPLFVEGHEIHMTCSIGVAVFPDDGNDVTTLMRKMDTALDRAKAAGRGDIYVFDPEADKSLLERLDLENDLRHALGRNEFMLMYQPEFDLQTGEVVSMEALLRWRKANGEFISPAKFIPVAEETGVIVPLSQWVLETACRELKQLTSALKMKPRIAVNLSPRQFKQDDLVEMISGTLTTHGVEPTSLELEITEGVLMDEPEKAAASLRSLRQLGITTAIDDFGTGYSSLSYLKRFPIDKLKMDRSFVSDIHQDKDGAALTESILMMAHQLGLVVVAEGIEVQEQLDFLRKVRCDAAQGFLLARPMFLADLINFLAQQPAAHLLPEQA